MRKWDRIIALCLALGLLLTGCGDRVGDESEDVYVDSVGAVSYTHLDVYKRQVLRWPSRTFVSRAYKGEVA